MSAFEIGWLTIGLLGQFCFFMRMFWQWVASERCGQSVVPIAFWFWSVGGGISLFAYAIYLRDPVFIVGQSTGLLVYSRNLFLIWKGQSPQERKDGRSADQSSAIRQAA